jgi:hypothetical protein
MNDDIEIREKIFVETYFKILQGAIPIFAWGERTASVNTVGVFIEVRTGYLPNTSRGFTV